MKNDNGGFLKWVVVGIFGVLVLGMFALGHDDENAVTGTIAQKIDAVFNGTTTSVATTTTVNTTKRITTTQKATITKKETTTRKPTTTRKRTTTRKPTTTRKITTAKKATTTKRVIVTKPEVQKFDYVLNTNTGKFHYAGCGDAKRIKEKNRKDYHGTRNEVIDMGYTPCAKCHP